MTTASPLGHATARVSCGPPLRVTHGLSTGITARHATGIEGGAAIPSRWTSRGNRTLCGKNRRPSDIGTGWQQLAHPGALVGFRIRHRETTPPPISAACPGPPVDEHW